MVYKIALTILTKKWQNITKKINVQKSEGTNPKPARRKKTKEISRVVGKGPETQISFLDICQRQSPIEIINGKEISKMKIKNYLTGKFYKKTWLTGQVLTGQTITSFKKYFEISNCERN